MKLFILSKWRGRILRYAPLILWIAVIFFFSSSLGAASNTSRFIRPALEWLFPDASAETLTIYHGYVRKFAHFAEYAILAFWSWRAFKGGNPHVGKVEEMHAPSQSRFRLVRLVEKYWHVISFLIVVLVASIDEFNQSLNTMRTGSGYDVLLDVFGGVCMILVILAASFFGRITHKQTA